MSYRNKILIALTVALVAARSTLAIDLPPMTSSPTGERLSGPGSDHGAG